MTTTQDLYERQDLGPFDGDVERAEIETSHLLTSLTDHPGWAELARIVDQEAAAYERSILTGRCADHADYVAKSAYVKALRSVIDTPVVFAARVESRKRPEQEEQ